MAIYDEYEFYSIRVGTGIVIRKPTERSPTELWRLPYEARVFISQFDKFGQTNPITFDMTSIAFEDLTDNEREVQAFVEPFKAGKGVTDGDSKDQ